MARDLSQAPQGLEQAQTLAEKYKSKRFSKLSKLEAYVSGDQYDGMPDFFNPVVDTPLMMRGPAVVYPIADVAIQQHVDFALGEGRFPRMSTGTSEDDSGLDDTFGLSPEDSQKFDAFLGHLCQAAKFESVCQEALHRAEGTGTVVAVYCARDGMPEIEIVPAKWCTPEFKKNGREVKSLTIAYPYIKAEIGPDGVNRATCLLYKRVIDDKTDTVFRPQVAPINGDEPSYEVDTKVQHGLGFCPVTWYKFKQGARKQDRIDGHAVHCRLLGEMDALNMALSQRYRAALYAGDPQMVETGVDPNEAVGQMGSSAQAHVVGHAGGSHSDVAEKDYASNARRGTADARKKGAGTVWRYTSPDSKVAMLCLPGDALKAIEEQANDLEDKLNASLGYTKASAERVRGAMSGKALGFLFARTTSFVDTVRTDFWDGFMMPALSMLLRICFTLNKTSATLFVVGLKQVQSILAKFERKVETEGVRWFPPRIQPQWGKYFEPTYEDELGCVQVAQTALQGGLVTKQLAIEKIAEIFNIGSPAEVVDAIKKEADEAQKTAMQNAADMAKATGGPAGPPKPGANGAAAKQKAADNGFNNAEANAS